MVVVVVVFVFVVVVVVVGRSRQKQKYRKTSNSPAVVDLLLSLQEYTRPSSGSSACILLPVSPGKHRSLA